MTKEEIYKASDVLNTILDNYLHGGEAAEVITKFEDELIKSNLTKEKSESENLDTEITEKHLHFPNIDMLTFEEIARHFANWQKQQLIAKAIYGTARPNDNEIWCNLASSNLKDGDIVKVIVINED